MCISGETVRGDLVRETVVKINYPELHALKVSTAALQLPFVAPFPPQHSEPLQRLVRAQPEGQAAFCSLRPLLCNAAP